MKHLLTATLLMATAIGMNAQTKKTEMTVSDFLLMPAGLSNQGEMQLYSTETSEDNKQTIIKIYDNDFSVVKTFSIDNIDLSTFPSYTITRTRETVPSLNGSATTTSPISSYIGAEPKNTFTVEEAQAYIKEDRGYEIYKTEETNDGYLFYLEGQSNYYEYEKYGYSYPTHIYKLSKETSGLNELYYSYNLTYTDNWTETKTDNTFPTSSWVTPLSLRFVSKNFSHGSADKGGDNIISQNLFNADDAYEYIMPIYTTGLQTTFEQKDYATGEVYQITENYGPRVTGYNIKSENGNTLATISFDEDWYGANRTVYELGTKRYLVVSLYMWNPSERKSIIYSIDGQNSTGIRQIGVVKNSLRVSPTIADRSQMITVEIDNSDNKPHEVRIVNAAGQTLKSIPVPAGQNSVQVSAAELTQGMNIVNVNGTQGGNCKIIVK